MRNLILSLFLQILMFIYEKRAIQCFDDFNIPEKCTLTKNFVVHSVGCGWSLTVCTIHARYQNLPSRKD